MEITTFWMGEDPETTRLNAVRLVAFLALSNEAEAATDPFVRRIRLNEMQAAIQAAKSDIEAIAEGLMIDPHG